MKAKMQGLQNRFRPFGGTWFDIINIDFTKWLALIKLPDLGISARRAAREADVSYPAAPNAFDCIRYSIPYHLAKSDRKPKGKIEADEAAYFWGRRNGNRGRGAKNKAIVFGILERKGKVHIETVTNVKAKTLLAGTIKKAKKGSIVYADKSKGYDSLMFRGYRHLSAGHSKTFGKGGMYINGTESFWSFAKERMAEHHGVGSERFLLYIKEMEWRYSNRDEDTFSLLLDYVLVVNN